VATGFAMAIGAASTGLDRNGFRKSCEGSTMATATGDGGGDDGSAMVAAGSGDEATMEAGSGGSAMAAGGGSGGTAMAA
jgi:hypothetical protein